MTPEEIIKLINDQTNNASELEGSRVFYVPDEVLPINLLGYMKHLESGMRYHQVVKMSTDQARAVGNALLIQSSVADPPPPSF